MRYLTIDENTMSHAITPFETIRRTNPAGNEFWSSRDFAKVLGYVNYRHFEAVIAKAKTACTNSGQQVEDHFVGSDQMVEIIRCYASHLAERRRSLRCLREWIGSNFVWHHQGATPSGGGGAEREVRGRQVGLLRVPALQSRCRTHRFHGKLYHSPGCPVGELGQTGCCLHPMQ